MPAANTPKPASKSVAKSASKTPSRTASATRKPPAKKNASSTATRKSSTARPSARPARSKAAATTTLSVPTQASAPSAELVTAAAPVVSRPAPQVVHQVPAPVPAQLPQVPVITSKSYAAPLSYVGSARRIGALVNKLGGGNAGVAVALWALVGLPAILLAWSFVTAWYFVIFGLFGVLTFPYRLMRRSQRKSQHIQQVSLATQQALLLQQQQQVYYGDQRSAG